MSTPTPTYLLAAQIGADLDEYWLNEIGHVAVTSLAKADWLNLQFCDELGGQFGWCWPTTYYNPEHPDFGLLAAYCPEILAEMLGHLEEEDREEYLSGVRWLCSMFLDRMNNGDPDIRAKLRAELADNFPFVGNLMRNVEERAVTVGIVPAEQGGSVSDDTACAACGYVNPSGRSECILCSSDLT